MIGGKFWANDIGYASRLVVNYQSNSGRAFTIVSVPGILDDSALDFGLFNTYHRTRSNVAMESSMDECPSVGPPVWMTFPKCSFVLECIITMVETSMYNCWAHKSLSDRLYGAPDLCGNRMAVSTHWWCIIRRAFKSFSNPWPMTIVEESMSADSDWRIAESAKTAFEWFSWVIPENRVL